VRPMRVLRANDDRSERIRQVAAVAGIAHRLGQVAIAPPSQRRHRLILTRQVGP
jgi:hypothetical protein